MAIEPSLQTLLGVSAQATMPAEVTSATTRTKLARDERIYQTHFSNIQHLSSKDKGYSPLPWYLRSVMWLFTAREWQLLTFFIMQGGKRALSWETDKEIGTAFNMGYKKISGYVKKLQVLGFIETKEVNGKRYVIVVDPYEALKKIVAAGKFKPEQLELLNEDLAKSGRTEIIMSSNPGKAVT